MGTYKLKIRALKMENQKPGAGGDSINMINPVCKVSDIEANLDANKFEAINEKLESLKNKTTDMFERSSKLQLILSSIVLRRAKKKLPTIIWRKRNLVITTQVMKRLLLT